jgi:hypothetical protein
MSHSSKIFQQLPVDIPNRSGFDCSFENMLTGTCGTLVPVFIDELLPNDSISLGHLSQVQLPPMATNFFGRIDMRLEAFFVPMRIIWAGWQNFFTMPFKNPFALPVVRPGSTPFAFFSLNGAPLADSVIAKTFAKQSLADYLGFKVTASNFTKGDYSIPNILPFVAYHKIYDDWYRNKLIQQPVFVNSTTGSNESNVSMLPFLQRVPVDNPEYTYGYQLDGTGSDGYSPFLVFPDGVPLFYLRQRNWAKDNFTTAALYPQASGDITGSVVEVDSSGDTSQISIPALRNANVLQRWMDRNNIAGVEYADQIKAHYGTRPSDAIMQKPIFLGSDVFGVYNRSVYSQSLADVSDTRNPFINSVGAKAADTSGFKDGHLAEFHATEHGYLIVLASLVPHAQYSTGTDRFLFHSVRGDFAIPLLQGLGEQPIYDSELTGGIANYDSSSKMPTKPVDIFGYQQQYYEYKYKNDQVHGYLVDGQTLDSFALQRSFEPSSLVLSTDFLQIPASFLDQVTAVDISNSSFSYWLDIYFNYKKVSTLSEYVIPTLGDLKNTHKESLPYRGFNL